MFDLANGICFGSCLRESHIVSGERRLTSFSPALRGHLPRSIAIDFRE